MAKWDLSKLEPKNYMPQDITDFMWAACGLTEVIGESFVASSDNGRILSWANGEGYWLTLILDDKGKPHVLIHDRDHPKQYAAIGYCRYHQINCELPWESGDE